ncbi:Uncharacterized protein PBTT_06436 [Plasmodiophora brassicae]|nr:hypothetical protein PBRA_001033 [Plasmodiophora brassicae]
MAGGLGLGVIALVAVVCVFSIEATEGNNGTAVDPRVAAEKDAVEKDLMDMVLERRKDKKKKDDEKKTWTGAFKNQVKVLNENPVVATATRAYALHKAVTTAYDKMATSPSKHLKTVRETKDDVVKKLAEVSSQPVSRAQLGLSVVGGAVVAGSAVAVVSAHMREVEKAKEEEVKKEKEKEKAKQEQKAETSGISSKSKVLLTIGIIVACAGLFFLIYVAYPRRSGIVINAAAASPSNAGVATFA